MKILFVVKGKFPLPEAASKRLMNYTKALDMEQNEVDLLPIFIRARFKFHDLLFSFLFPFYVFLRVLKNLKSHSVVFIYGFGWVSKLFIILASKLMHKYVTLEVNEKPYSIHGSRRDTILKYIEPIHEFCQTRLVYPLLDGFIVISEELHNYIDKYKSTNAVICKVPILVDYEYYQKRVNRPNCHVPFLIHSATINDHKDGIIDVFKAFVRINMEERVELFFYLTSKLGLSSVRNRINQILNNNNLWSRVHFLGDIDEDSLISYQAHCDFVIVNKVDSVQNRYNFSTRLGEYLALGRPIITSDVGEVKNYLQNNVSCLFVDPTNQDELVAAIIRVLKDSDFARTIGNNGRSIAKTRFDYKANSRTINSFFLSVLKR